MGNPSTELDAVTILDTLAQHSDNLYELGAPKLGLFGSFARGEQTASSDIGLFCSRSRIVLPDLKEEIAVVLVREGDGETG